MNITQKFTIALTTDELGVVQQGLMDLPWKVSNPVLAEIDRQFREQTKQREGEQTDGIKG